MKPLTAIFLFFFSLFIFSAAAADKLEKLNACLHIAGLNNISVRGDPSYLPLLHFSMQNLRFASPRWPKPALIVLPQDRRHVQLAVVCTVKHGWQPRVRSGGHSYEGLSYTADSTSFIMIDLMNMDTVQVNLTDDTAWLEGGTTLGQLYTAISRASPTHAFPAGTCPTVGSGGHLAGGGIGMLTRKFGLGGDNVIDVLLVDAHGRLLDRKSMGEDVFWALRGGGGGSWGIVVAWKIKLHRVPPVVTAFTVFHNGTQAVTDTIWKWQHVAPDFPEDLFMRVRVYGSFRGFNVIASFHGLFLGNKTDLLKQVTDKFPELGLQEWQCKEMSWYDSVMYFSETPEGTRMDDRYFRSKNYTKYKSDVLREAVSPAALRGLWDELMKVPEANVILSPLGGIMATFADDATPFPYRKGWRIDMQYVVSWNTTSEGEQRKLVDYVRELYKYMEPYVSSSPRAAYVNYLDLDLGVARNGTASVEEARRWGEKYFDHNYDRLVNAKTLIDPQNIFRNAQSIPPQ